MTRPVPSLAEIRWRSCCAASRLPWTLLNRAVRRWPGDPELLDGFWLDAHYAKWARGERR